MKLFTSTLTFILLIVGSVTSLALEERAISNNLLSKLYLAHQFAAAAYCPNNNVNPPSSKIYCPTNNCGLVEADNVTALIEFSEVGVAGSTGYVAIDIPRSKIIVSFRGSESLANDLADANLPLVPASQICKNCYVEAGFYSFWLAVRTSVLTTVSNAALAHPSFSIDVIGHSLGAAGATLAVAEIRNAGHSADLYSFCSPRVGDPTFAKYVSAQNGVSGANYRVTHLNDWVPKAPPPSGYLHIANEYFITSPNGAIVTAKDITVYKGFEGVDYTGGNAGTKTTDLTFTTHEWIFDRIVECDPDAVLR